MIFKSLNRFLKANKIWQPAMPEVKDAVINYPESESTEQSLHTLISRIYDINADDEKLRQITDQKEAGSYFDRLRKKYPIRREFTNYTVKISRKLEKEIKILKALRFNISQY